MKMTISQQVVLLAAIALTGAAAEPLRISSFTIDGGGVVHSRSEDDRFVLSGTIGQPDTGEIMTGGAFALTGGFWFESPSGDCNANGLVDLGDHAGFVECMTTPQDLGPDPGCECYDVDGDGGIDLVDFAVNQRTFFGK